MSKITCLHAEIATWLSNAKAYVCSSKFHQDFLHLIFQHGGLCPLLKLPIILCHVLSALSGCLNQANGSFNLSTNPPPPTCPPPYIKHDTHDILAVQKSSFYSYDSK